MSSTRKISRFGDELRFTIFSPRFVQEFLKIVNFKMSSELFETHMLKCLINIDKEELEEKRSLLRDKVRLFSVKISNVLVHAPGSGEKGSVGGGEGQDPCPPLQSPGCLA